jgi:hypothetical protein
MTPLPPRPKLGKRERVFYLTLAWVTIEGIGGHFGWGVSETILMSIVTLAGVVIGGDTYRASGTAKEPTA